MINDSVMKLRDAVAAYCNKYCIAPPFSICDLFDIEDRAHWAAEDWPNAKDAGCYVLFSAAGDLLYIGEAAKLGPRLYAYFTDNTDKTHGIPINWGPEEWSNWPEPPRLLLTVRVNEPYERLSLEAYLILRLDPPANKRGRVIKVEA